MVGHKSVFDTPSSHCYEVFLAMGFFAAVYLDAVYLDAVYLDVIRG
jgi:hypothetical protein